MKSDRSGQTAKPSEWFRGVGPILFVHAHPDDETIVTGGTLAGLAASGLEPALVTCTRGEQGEVREGPFAELEGTSALAAHRKGELQTALAMLGVTRHAMLGTQPARAAGLDARTYEDSGMKWGPDGFAIAGDAVTEHALTRADAVEPITDLLALADAWGIRGIVSYDQRGGYGHPDHVFAHRIARAVAHGLEIPFWEIALPGAAGEPNVEVYDVSEWWQRKVAALRAYSTQLEVLSEEEIEHVGGQRMTLDRAEYFRELETPKV